MDCKTFAKKLDNLSKIDYKPILNEVGTLLETESKLRCPVDTGELRQSIKQEIGEKYARVYTSKSYAP